MVNSSQHEAFQESEDVTDVMEPQGYKGYSCMDSWFYRWDCHLFYFLHLPFKSHDSWHIQHHEWQCCKQADANLVHGTENTQLRNFELQCEPTLKMNILIKVPFPVSAFSSVSWNFIGLSTTPTASKSKGLYYKEVRKRYTSTFLLHTGMSVF